MKRNKGEEIQLGFFALALFAGSLSGGLPGLREPYFAGITGTCR